MTFAGKTLQDIYNTGSNQLSEMEETATSKLANKSTNHLSERQESEQQSKMEVAAKAAAVDEDLKRQAREASDRIRTTLEREKAANEAFMQEMTDRLLAFNGDIKKQIEELRTSYESSLDDGYLRASDHFSSMVEGANAGLHTQHHDSGQRLRSQSGFFVNNLQQKLDHSLWDSRGSEKQSNSTLHRNYMQKANNIESHFTTLLQRLNNDFKVEFTKLETYAKEGQEDSVSDSEALSKKIDQVLVEVEKDINEIFGACVENNQAALTEKFSGTIGQVSELGTDTGRQLREDANEIVSNLTVAARESEKNLKKKCEEVTERMHLDMQAFVGRINSKVNESDLVRRQLTEAKSKVINEIRDELIAIKNSFEARLNEVTKDARDNLSSIAAEVDSDMKGAYDQSLFKITSDSNSAKLEIEEATKGLLALINEQKNNALKEIARAAGEST